MRRTLWAAIRRTLLTSSTTYSSAGIAVAAVIVYVLYVEQRCANSEMYWTPYRQSAFIIL